MNTGRRTGLKEEMELSRMMSQFDLSQNTIFGRHLWGDELLNHIFEREDLI